MPRKGRDKMKVKNFKGVFVFLHHEQIESTVCKIIQEYLLY